MARTRVIDLIVGFRASERVAMREISRSIHEIPGFEQFFYGFVPTLHLTAAVLLVVLFATGAACIGTGSTPLMVAGGVALCVALPAMTRGTPDTPVETPVRMMSGVGN